MIRYEGMKSEEMKGSENMGQLPAGTYVAKVIDARIEGTEPDQQLAVYLDVSEGEYEGFFTKKYNAAKEAGSKYGEVKYKGVIRLRIPNEKNTKALYPESDIRKMNDMGFRFEKSNPGFRWEGDERKLIGLTVGINMQEDEYNGNVFTRIGRFEVAQDVRAGTVKPMQPRKRKETAPVAPPVPDPLGFAPVDVETPFF